MDNVEDREFLHFPKIPLGAKVPCWITEKIDGTNAQIVVLNDRTVIAGSRNRWISAVPTSADNFGFAGWVRDNAGMLSRLGPGRHFGEWWGAGIGRRYGLTERRFWLFDRHRWNPETLPEGLPREVGVVPLLATCDIESLAGTMAYVEGKLRDEGSVAAPGWREPEGYVVQIGIHGEDVVSFKVTDSGNKSKWKFEAT